MPAAALRLGRNMTTLATIGSGHIGGTVARLAAAAGYDVVLSNSRGPDTLKELVDEIGPRARAATPAEAAQAGDLVVVSVPLRAYRQVPVEPLAGKVVMDTNNYYPARDGQLAELDDGSATTGQLLQRHLPGSHVVKVFNNIVARHIETLARPAGSPDRSALAIAGVDAAAKATVTAFLDAIGWDAVDAGPLAEGWRFERDTPAYGLPYFGGRDFQLDDPGSPTGADTIRAALAAASR
jgi:predicted dinucleotide-binding enzyme